MPGLLPVYNACHIPVHAADVVLVMKPLKNPLYLDYNYYSCCENYLISSLINGPNLSNSNILAASDNP